MNIIDQEVIEKEHFSAMVRAFLNPIIYHLDLMDIRAKMRKQQVKARLARREYLIAKANRSSEVTKALLFARWSNLKFIASLWVEAVKLLDKGKK